MFRDRIKKALLGEEESTQNQANNDSTSVLTDTLEQALDAVVSIDQDNIVQFFNAAAENLWGYRRNEVIGQNVKMLVPQEIRANHDNYVNANRTTSVDKIVGTSREVEVERKDGERVWAQLSLSKVHSGGDILYTAFVKDITKEKNARETIDQTLEQALDGVVTIDENNLIQYFNKSAENLWGYSREEVIGQNVKMLVPKEIQSQHDSFVNANRSTGVDKIVGTNREVIIERKDGTQIWGALSLSKIRLDGTIKYTAFVKDITEEKNTRETINQTLEQALDGVITIDEHNIVQFFNKSAENLWGYRREEVIGQNVKMLVPQEIRANHDNFVNSNRTTGVDKIVGTNREVSIERKDGTKIWGALSLSKVRLEGKILYTAFVKDISAERDMRETVNQTLEQALDAVVTIDHNNIVQFFNASAEELWGYDREDVVGKNVNMLVPKAIRAQHDSLVNANRTTGVDKIVGTNREVEIERKDGEVIWGALSLSKIDLDGRILYTAFVKNVDEEVKQRKVVETLSLVANETDNSVVITDAKGQTEYVNNGFTRLTGYTLEEAMGRKPGEMLQGPETDKAIVKEIREKISSQKPFYAEILNYSKQGEKYWISLAVNPVFDDAGKITRFVSIQTNITETKLKSLEFNFKLEAISRANAVAEFQPDGALETCNKLYLNIFGYHNVEEVVGKNMGQFLHSEFTSSNDYQSLWQQLKSGQFVSGEFKHQNNNSQQCWINGSFNPIFNTSGELTKIVFFGNDVTARKFGITEIASALSDLEDGGLTHRVEGDFGEELNQIRDSLNVSLDKLQSTVENILSISDQVAEGSNEIAAGNAQLNERTEQQASSLEETAASMEEMTTTLQTSAKNAEEAHTSVVNSRELAIKGKEVVTNTVTAMQNISESSKKIADIISAIDEIAFQTNLLALNAAVEAARAGEQGRGFAVVASEVRNLAQRSATSAKEISDLIKDSLAKVEQGSSLAIQSGDTLEEIVNAVLAVSDQMQDIMEAAKQQESGIQQVNIAVAQMDSMTQDNAALVEEASASSQMMLNQVVKMRQDLSFFKIGDNSSQATASYGHDTQPLMRRPSTSQAPKRANRPAPRADNASFNDAGDDEWEKF